MGGREAVEDVLPLPPLRPALAVRRGAAVLANAPVNLPTAAAANGKLTFAEVKAAWGDAKFQCPLHKTKAAACMLLTKHEVCLANRLWCFICECGSSVQLDSVWGLLRMLEAEMSKDDSLVAQAQHRHIFKLTNAKTNPLFGLCIRRIHGGIAATFREFLHALCPCASDARLELYLHWHLGNWTSEQAFVKTVKGWKRDCKEHWEKSVITAKQRRQLQADMRALDCDGDKVLSVDDLVKGGAIDRQAAEEMMANHDINGDHVLNLNEFLAMLCPPDQRSKGDGALEEMLRGKFECITQSWKTGSEVSSPPPAPARTRRVFDNLDEDHSGTVALDELVGHLDLRTAFGLLEVYDEDADGQLSLEELETMLRPDVTA